MRYKEEFFYSGGRETLEHIAQRGGSAPSLETVKVRLVGVLSNLI